MRNLLTTLLLLLLALASSAVELPPQSVVLPGIDEESMKARFAESDMQQLEGIWYYPNEEMTLAIEKWDGEHNIGYRIILLASNDIELLPGIVMGYVARSAVDMHRRSSAWPRSTAMPPRSPSTRHTGK